MLTVLLASRPSLASALSCDGSIQSNFNGTAIPAGRTVWFNSVFKSSGISSAGATIFFQGQTVSFSAGGIPYTLSVPDAAISFDPAATTATTTFDAALNRWVTRVPLGFDKNVFLAGLSFSAPAGGLPGGINPVTWSGAFSSDRPGVTVQWQWAAAVYTSFSTDHGALGVKPVDGSSQNPYANSDHAGTPENFKAAVIGGARGGWRLELHGFVQRNGKRFGLPGFDSDGHANNHANEYAHEYPNGDADRYADGEPNRNMDTDTDRQQHTHTHDHAH